MNTTILGTGSYLPDHVLTNAELARRLRISEQWIADKTGIDNRRVAAPDQSTSDLAARAAKSALEAAGVEPQDVDLVVLATATKDQPIPATASIVQAKINASRAAAFDVDAACTGFIYALVAAHSMLVADPRRHTALVVGSEVYSRFLNYQDKRTCVLLGDGAGAVVLAKVPTGTGLLSTILGSDGDQADIVSIPAGGSRQPTSNATVAAKGHYLKMQGREARAFAEKALPDLVSKLLQQAGLKLPGVRLVVPHQANGVMISDWATVLELVPGQMHTTVRDYGNTGAASIPITLDDGVRSGCITAGDAVLFLAFGGGVTWGGVTLRWQAT